MHRVGSGGGNLSLWVGTRESGLRMWSQGEGMGGTRASWTGRASSASVAMGHGCHCVGVPVDSRDLFAATYQHQAVRA